MVTTQVKSGESSKLPHAQHAGGQAVCDVLTLIAWLAIAFGLAEALYWLVKQHVFGSLIFLHPGYWWMSSLAQLALFAIPGIPLAIAAWHRPRWDVATFAVTALSWLGWLNLLLLLAALYHWAWLLAGLGLAATTGRLYKNYAPCCLSIARFTLAPMVLLVSLGGVVQHSLQRQREVATVAALPAPPKQAPNILLIVLDAVRADALEIYGRDREVAPNLASLAAKGVVFEQAWSAAPWTLPSHAGMFTGRLPHELSADWSSPLDHSHPTLAGELSARGWLTAGFVGNRRYCTVETGLAQGFSHYEDHRFTFADMEMSTALGRGVLLGPLPVHFGLRHRPGRKFASEISGGLLRWLDRRGDRPFFAFLNFFDVHDAYVPRPGYETTPPRSQEETLFRKNWWWTSKEGLSSDQVQRLRITYEDCIRGLDAHIGWMLSELERRGELKNTIIIVTSDHGEHFGDHNLFLHGNSLYEPLIHVPLIVVWPNQIPAGMRVNTPVSLCGLPDTVVELLGASARFPGDSWVHCWNPNSTNWPSEIVAAHIASQSCCPPCHGRSPVAHGPMHCVRDGDFKYIRSEDGTEELYHLGLDPAESQNFALDSSHTALLNRMRNLFERNVAERQSTHPNASVAAPRIPATSTKVLRGMARTQ